MKYFFSTKKIFIFFYLFVIFMCDSYSILAQKVSNKNDLVFTINGLKLAYKGFSIGAEYQYSQNSGIQFEYARKNDFSYFSNQYASNQQLPTKSDQYFLMHKYYFAPRRNNATRIYLGTGLSLQYDYNNGFYARTSKFYGVKIDFGMQFKSPNSAFCFQPSIGYNHFLPTSNNSYKEPLDHIQLQLSFGFYISKINEYF